MDRAVPSQGGERSAGGHGQAPEASPCPGAYKGVGALPRTLELVRDLRGPGDGSAVLRFVDQSRLPGSLVIGEARRSSEVVEAIMSLSLRGAPAIGVAGAAALALYAVNESGASDTAGLAAELEALAPRVASVRPTAVNLAWGVGRVMAQARKAVQDGLALPLCKQALFDEVKQMEAEDEATNRRLGQVGAGLIPAGCRVLTHCNAGSLATVFFGTALGVVYTAAAQGKVERVFADETRPMGQGARLTVWELAQVGIPSTLLCDDMAAVLMAEGKVDAVLVGADRICRNGDVANKVGTYGLAVAARHHKVPFYVVAPSTSVDATLARGEDVVIEYRPQGEVAHGLPEGVEVFNPAFDITPHGLITAIVTECGVFAPSELAAAYGPHEGTSVQGSSQGPYDAS